jgi:2-C-methyl-D-erythritol 4-phosphate cytidylyltransferase/2-C-methyl-D-erythritol 2,4-cyclodiphosphate synthase
MHVAAIIAGGGRGTRFGTDVPKQFLDLGGRSMLRCSNDAFMSSERLHEVVAVVPAGHVAAVAADVVSPLKRLRVVAGGVRRQDSVANAFDALEGRADIIVVHDAARPCVSQALIARTIDAAILSGAAIPALQSRDTVKEARQATTEPPEGGAAGTTVVLVARTIARETIYLVQTPQAFRASILGEAIALGRSGADATDEAALAERAGHEIRIVEGDPRNIKITTPDDLTLARWMMKVEDRERPDGAWRTGAGYDLHRLVVGRPLVLGGVIIPFSLGLDGHSDADALCHAVTDAILGAAAAGDIGRFFPDTDARWKGARSLDLLRRAVAIVRECGFDIENVDAVVVAERPKLVPHLDAIVDSLAGALGVPSARVSVKGKTNEGVDEVGRGGAIAVHAVALLRVRG